MLSLESTQPLSTPGLTSRPSMPPEPVDRRDMTEKDVADYVRERYEVASRLDRPFKEKCIENWRQVMDILPDDWPYWTKIFDPATSVAVTDTVEATMMSLFPKDQFFDLRPEEQQDELATVLMRQMMQHVMTRRIRYKMLKYGQFWEAVIFGNGICRHGAKLWVDRQHHGLYGADVEKREVWPSGENVRRVDFYPGPTGATPDEWPYCLERLTVTMDKLRVSRWGQNLSPETWKKLEESAYAVDAQANTVSTQDESKFDLYEMLRQGGYEVEQHGLGSTGPNAVKYVEILLYWEAGFQGEGCGRLVVLSGNRDIVLYDGPEPYGIGRKPYSTIGFWYMGPRTWQCRALPDVLASLQWQLNMRQAQGADFIESVLHPMRLINKMSLGVQDISLLTEFWPGSVIEGADISPNSIRDLDDKRTPVELFRDIDSVRANINRMSRVTDVGRGMLSSQSAMPKGADTASGLAQLLQTQNKAAMFKWLMAEETGLRDGLQLDAAILQAVMTVPQVVEVMGREPVLERLGLGGRVLVRPQDIAGKWDFYCLGSTQSMENPDQAALAEKWLATGMQIPGVQDEINISDAYWEIGELIGVRNARRWRRSAEEVAARQQQREQAMMRAQQRGIVR